MKIRNVENNVENNINGSTWSSTPTIKQNTKHVGVDDHIDPDTKNNNGITLIALIITIIIMLILAGVVISLTLGENGLFSTARYAVAKTEEESAREKLELLLVNMQAEKETNSNYNNEYLTNKIEEQDMTIIDEDIVLVNGWMFRNR